MRWLLPLGLAAVLTFAWLLGSLATNSRPHDFSGRCGQCHLSAPRPGQKGIFIQDIDSLCQQCHEVAQKNSHPSEILPSMKLPSGFTVDWQGRITCATCHDPHRQDLTANPFMLRSGVRGKEFCALCHHELAAGGRHPVASGIAHAKSWTPPGRETLDAVLDRVSLECVACHEGSVGPAAGFRVAGQETFSFQGRNFSHPIGMDYAEAAARNRQLRPPDDLSPLVSLYEGKVGCASCHSHFSRQPMLLVFSNQGSALCLECHLK